jgi:hypothetical protein
MSSKEPTPQGFELDGLPSPLLRRSLKPGMNQIEPPNNLVEWVTTLWSYSDAKDVAWFHTSAGETEICPHGVSYGQVALSLPRP